MRNKTDDPSTMSFWEILREDMKTELPVRPEDRTLRLVILAVLWAFSAGIIVYFLKIHHERAITASLVVLLFVTLSLITVVFTNSRSALRVLMGIYIIPAVLVLTFDKTGGVANLMWMLIVPYCVLSVCGLMIGGGIDLALALFVLAAYYSPLKQYLPQSSIYAVREIYPLLYLFVSIVSFAICYFERRQVLTLYRRALQLEKEKQSVDEKNRTMTRKLVRSIVHAMDAKDNMTGDHSIRVATYASMLAESMDLSEKQIEAIYQGGILHDIGKIGIPDEVRNKTDSLSEAEYEKIKEHTTIGKRILEDVTWLPNVSICAQSHHEWYNGEGYPHGLKGEEIPLEARIVAIADSFDAMNANRIYRKRRSKEYIISELKRGAGRQFDPALIRLFLPIAEKILEEDGPVSVEEETVDNI